MNINWFQEFGAKKTDYRTNFAFGWAINNQRHFKHAVAEFQNGTYKKHTSYIIPFLNKEVSEKFVPVPGTYTLSANLCRLLTCEDLTDIIREQIDTVQDK